MTDLKNPKKKSKTWSKLLVLTFGAGVFLTDHPQFNSVSLFETSISQVKRKKKKYRLPSSASPQVVQYDCKQPKKALEISTDLETIRIEAINCGNEVHLKNISHDISLTTFPTKDKTFSSEFAYLQKGLNNFQLKAGKYRISLNINRTE